MAWDKHVPGCFGGLYFAKNPQEVDRAFEWLIDLRKGAIGWEQVRAQLEAFLNSKKAEHTHMEEQLEVAKTMLKPWLDD